MLSQRLTRKVGTVREVNGYKSNVIWTEKEEGFLTLGKEMEREQKNAANNEKNQ